MERVVSKNLFNFPLKGIAEGQVAEIDAQIKQIQSSGPPAEIGRKIQELSLKDDDESRNQLLGMIRANNAGMVMMVKMVPPFQEAAKQISVTEFKVSTSHDGNFDVLVEVYTPQTLVGKTDNAAYIFAHGGGCVSGSANDSKPFLDFIALSSNVVVFNVDYRLAPETKCPNNVKDFYEVVKYVCHNAQKLNVDPKKICIAGESGGGYVCLGTCVLLAQNNESHLIKLAFPSICMVDDYCFSDPGAMMLEERNNHMVMRRVWQMIAADITQQAEDPLLYPGKSTDVLLARFPPTIIIEGEFDMFFTSSSRLATRLRRAGRLLEFVVLPGVTHAVCLFPSFRMSEMFNGTIKQALQAYLHE